MTDTNLNQWELLRFTTAWSVDDGKSTLIGRLLFETKSLFEDQYEKIAEQSESKWEDYVNLALITDGLKDEIEQGITIDVAYRYFTTPKRKFIIADCPGHIQYTRNMVTGASNANVALILVDARHGLVEQTARHTFIASLLGINHIVFCINKMDLVGYEEEAYEKVKKQLEGFTSKLDVKDTQFVPMSALHGDNVVEKSDTMPWYEGPTLLYILENIYIASDHNHIDCRFPVQTVIRPQKQEYHDYRGYAGKVAGGVFKSGDEVTVLPSWFSTSIVAIDKGQESIEQAYSPMSVTIRLKDDIDVSRGDMIVRKNNQPTVSQDIDVMLCWFNKKPLNPAAKYSIKHTSKETRCVIKDVHYVMDINTLHRILEFESVGMNDVAKISIRTMSPLLFDKYKNNKTTGSIILIDEATNETVAAGMII